MSFGGEKIKALSLLIIANVWMVGSTLQTDYRGRTIQFFIAIGFLCISYFILLGDYQK